MTYEIPWLQTKLNDYANQIIDQTQLHDTHWLLKHIDHLAEKNRQTHEQQCINLNPATNIMNPRAEALLSSGLGTRPSLGHPGDKYEMGLEAIEQIEIITNTLAREIFSARFAEIRVGSGALANLYAFMATCKPGDNIIVPPASIGGHVTHHNDGAAGLFGLNIHQAEVDRDCYTIDLNKLRDQAHRLKPALITIGGSLNLLPHPVTEIRGIADEVGAYLLFDAAHQCGMIAGKHWPNPLDEGAHIMTFSTYKSLGGPPGGLIVSNSSELMEKIDAIAFPGLTANFDVAKSAALAVTLLDWREYGSDYAKAMVETSRTLASALQHQDLPIFTVNQNDLNFATDSHQFAIEATSFGGGQSMSRHLRKANMLMCGIGLPINEVQGDLNGLRIGTPEIVRTGMEVQHMEQLSGLIADSLLDRRPQEDIANEVSEFRQQFNTLKFVSS
ncbi:MAG: aminotransferase class I/II-fold pyridoxal phosphate-dependent enzyme [Gammaproteobacteria bacterium]|jgi:glycine hydroxymethyltransferase|nr:aminotransferase class I/II-fold pyridoxal phosphate-dependent enzyme [Gammaproteobacteria bacterium]MBT3724682.1 aminotransferase class I/II-fold pyridoxal phosphate-dependent enzyme [Gammaproteobacteria bacterium]MBT4076397.1 aminotransferase class I/II-fold pyridoxal phosphate-dependent enzyme [Gammaproteobacteria bacterium]MBT4192787.1 aminotransferase class I/II-fold pyridoxal phosphate-dependent enzyme [Gammaproteobacteria bacterium]MBT4448708.1 aminotransferase class I/II-fold pyridox